MELSRTEFKHIQHLTLTKMSNIQQMDEREDSAEILGFDKISYDKVKSYLDHAYTNLNKINSDSKIIANVKYREKIIKTDIVSTKRKIEINIKEWNLDEAISTILREIVNILLQDIIPEVVIYLPKISQKIIGRIKDNIKFQMLYTLSNEKSLEEFEEEFNKQVEDAEIKNILSSMTSLLEVLGVHHYILLQADIKFKYDKLFSSFELNNVNIRSTNIIIGYSTESEHNQYNYEEFMSKFDKYLTHNILRLNVEAKMLRNQILVADHVKKSMRCWQPDKYDLRSGKTNYKQSSVNWVWSCEQLQTICGYLLTEELDTDLINEIELWEAKIPDFIIVDERNYKSEHNYDKVLLCTNSGHVAHVIGHAAIKSKALDNIELAQIQIGMTHELSLFEALKQDITSITRVGNRIARAYLLWCIAHDKLDEEECKSIQVNKHSDETFKKLLMNKGFAIIETCNKEVRINLNGNRDELYVDCIPNSTRLSSYQIFNQMLLARLTGYVETLIYQKSPSFELIDELSTRAKRINTIAMVYSKEDGGLRQSNKLSDRWGNERDNIQLALEYYIRRKQTNDYWIKRMAFRAAGTITLGAGPVSMNIGSIMDQSNLLNEPDEVWYSEHKSAIIRYYNDKIKDMTKPEILDLLFRGLNETIYTTDTVCFMTCRKYGKVPLKLKFTIEQLKDIGLEFRTFNEHIQTTGISNSGWCGISIAKYYDYVPGHKKKETIWHRAAPARCVGIMATLLNEQDVVGLSDAKW